MRFADGLGFAWDSLRKRRLRSFLTSAGVMIGIGALVSMISFGKGMQRNVTRAFRALAGAFNPLFHRKFLRTRPKCSAVRRGPPNAPMLPLALTPFVIKRVGKG